jgi:hypothetical protein
LVERCVLDYFYEQKKGILLFLLIFKELLEKEEEYEIAYIK